MIKTRKKPRIRQAGHLSSESYVFCLEFEGDWGSRGRRGEGGGQESEKGSSLLFHTLVLKLSPLQEFSWLCPPSGMPSHFLCLPCAQMGLSDACLLPPSGLTALWRTPRGHASVDATLLTRRSTAAHKHPARKRDPRSSPHPTRHALNGIWAWKK